MDNLDDKTMLRAVMRGDVEMDAQALVIAELSVGQYAPVRSAYKLEIKGAIIEYFLTEGAKVTKFRNAYYRAVTQYFGESFEIGYQDGGGEVPFDPEDQEWLTSAIEGEKGYVLMLFDQMKAMKKEGITVQEVEAWADERAEGYAKTADSVYSQGKVRGFKDRMLTFFGIDGLEPCDTCIKLKGVRKKASWWIQRGLVPFRGNRNYI